MTGGSGGDALVNEGLVDVKSVSTGNGTAGSGTLTGYGAADVSIVANASAIGMDGGADGDWLKNEKTLKAVSEASATGRSVSVSLIGIRQGPDERAGRVCRRYGMASTIAGKRQHLRARRPTAQMGSVSINIVALAEADRRCRAATDWAAGR
jgi:hypothetical protein